MNSHRIIEEMVGDIAIATLRDRKVIDESVIQELGNELISLIEVEGRRKLIVDFKEVEYYSDAALGKLIVLGKKMKAVNGSLRFCSIRPSLYEVFVITRLNKVFDIRENREQALVGL
ncbi:MAG: STAS domain-containing protein [Blastocatellia bacterium]